MNDEIIYDIWLSLALKPGNRKIKMVKSIYKKISEFYFSNEYEKRILGFFTNSDLITLDKTSLEDAKRIFEKSIKLGYKIISLYDDKYPKLLEQISNPPGILYVNGDESCLNSKFSIAIVGTRKATQLGANMAYDISSGLCKSNAVIVSGGAIGIDFFAHKGALDSNGKTIAVLGCGINYPYLMQNYSLRNKIALSGAVISEYPPDTPCGSYTFPIRNRIISGLTLGTVIIEAGEKSGSLITANLANEQNRDVFVLPIDENNPRSVGSNLLIRDGASVITSADDIILQYNYKINFEKNNRINEYISEKSAKNNLLEVQESSKSLEIDLPENLKLVYDSLKKGKKHIDDISSEVNIKMKDLLPILTELELMGMVKALSGRMYEII